MRKTWKLEFASCQLFVERAGIKKVHKNDLKLKQTPIRYFNLFTLIKHWILLQLKIGAYYKDEKYQNTSKKNYTLLLAKNVSPVKPNN